MKSLWSHLSNDSETTSERERCSIFGLSIPRQFAFPPSNELAVKQPTRHKNGRLVCLPRKFSTLKKWFFAAQQAKSCQIESE